MQSMTMPIVDILLSTYNGASFLDEQIGSLCRQSIHDFRVLVRDDASSDATPALIHAWAARRPHKIHIVELSSRRLGILQGFSKLLQHAQAEYVMFCDQDDIWLPFKVQVSLQKMKQAEARWGKNTPVLVHSDLVVVDGGLKVLSPSFFACHKINEAASSLNRLLAQNSVTGCTVMINRKLRQITGAIPPQARLHDWWLSLVAAAAGRIETIQAPTVLYRQHGGNVVGASLNTGRDMLRHARRLRGLYADMRATIGQANCLLDRHGRHMPAAQRRLCAEFASLEHLTWFEKKRLILRRRFFKRDAWRNLAWFALV